MRLQKICVVDGERKKQCTLSVRLSWLESAFCVSGRKILFGQTLDLAVCPTHWDISGRLE